MKKAILLIVILLTTSIDLFSQSLSLENVKTPYSVGFKTLLLSDGSRQFKFKNQTQAVNRPIRVFVWYPTVKSKSAKLINFADYVYTSSLTKEANQLTPAEKAELQQKLVTTLEFFEVTAEQVANLMKAQTKFIASAPEKKGKFPLLVFGNLDDGFHYAMMAEFLASSGYIVVSLPSLGANEGERCGYDLNCLKLQQNDMEFAIEKMHLFQNADTSKIGLIAWSFSGLATAHLQMKNPVIKAVVSLDAATGYQYGKEILDQSKELEMSKTNTPFLHFYGLGGESRVARNFEFFNAYQSKNKRLVTFKNLKHSDFISLYGNGVRVAKNDKNESALSEIRQVNLITLEFLNAYLKNNRKSLNNFNELLKKL